MSMHHQSHNPDEPLAVPSRPLSALQQEISQKMKDAFVAWSIDHGIQCGEGIALLGLKIPKVQGGAARVADEIGPAIEQFAASEIRAAQALPGQDTRGLAIALQVREKIAHEFKIVRNEFLLLKRGIARLMSPDPYEQRGQLIRLGRRSLEFALQEHNSAVVLDPLQPLLSAAKALGLPDIETRIQPALEEYRSKVSLQAPVFVRAFSAVLESPRLSALALEGMPEAETHRLMCDATRQEYPAKETYRRLRITGSEASLPFLTSVMDTLGASGVPYGLTVSRLFRELPEICPKRDIHRLAIEREIDTLYGAA